MKGKKDIRKQSLLERFIKEKLDTHREVPARGATKGEPRVSRKKLHACLYRSCTVLSVKDIARRVGCAQSTVRSWKSQDPFRQMGQALQQEYIDRVRSFIFDETWSYVEQIWPVISRRDFSGMSPAVKRKAVTEAAGWYIGRYPETSVLFADSETYHPDILDAVITSLYVKVYEPDKYNVAKYWLFLIASFFRDNGKFSLSVFTSTIHRLMEEYDIYRTIPADAEFEMNQRELGEHFDFLHFAADHLIESLRDVYGVQSEAHGAHGAQGEVRHLVP